MQYPVCLCLAAITACAFPVFAVARGNEGGPISTIIDNAMIQGGPIGAIVPCYELPPGSPPGTMPGISSLTRCVLIPQDRVAQVVVPGSQPGTNQPTGRAGAILPGTSANR